MVDIGNWSVGMSREWKDNLEPRFENPHRDPSGRIGGACTLRNSLHALEFSPVQIQKLSGNPCAPEFRLRTSRARSAR